MIPLSLRLINFLSYGAEPTMVDFSDLGVACLSGANGAGKTALLEALTWALWGKARGGNIEPEKLLNSSVKGNSGGGMRVECEFCQNGERYRLERSFRKKGKDGNTTLTLSVWDPQKERFRLWSAGVRPTQELLLELLGMDYETFITSRFIMQGQADKFHRASDAEKKEILGKILSLSVYERLEESAKLEARLLKEKREMLSAERRSLMIDLPEEKTVQKELSELTGRKEEQEKRLGELKKRAQALSEELTGLLGELRQLESASQEKERLERELAEVGRRKQGIEVELKGMERLLAQSEEILAGAEFKKALCRKAEHLTKLLNERNRLTGEIAVIDLTIAEREREVVGVQAGIREKRANLLGELKNIDASLSEEEKLSLAANEKPRLIRELAKLSEKSNQLNSLQEESRQIQRQISVEYGHRQEELNNLRKQLSALEKTEEELTGLQKNALLLSQLLAELERKQAVMLVLRQELEEGRKEESRNREKMLAIQKRRQALKELSNLAKTPAGRCPLCQQELSSTGKVAINSHLTGEEEILCREKSELENRETELKKCNEVNAEKIKSLETELERLSVKTKDFPALNSKIEQMRAGLEEKASIASAAGKLAQLLAQGKGVAPESEERCSELSAAILVLQDIPQLYSQAQQKLSALAVVEERLGELALFRKRRLEIENQAKELENESTRLKEIIDRKSYAQKLLSQRVELVGRLDRNSYDRTAHKRAEQELANLPDVEQELAGLTRARERKSPLQALLTELTEQVSKGQARLGELDGKIAHLPVCQKQCIVTKQEFEKLTLEISTLERERAKWEQQEGALREKLFAICKNQSRAEELRGKILELTERERTAGLLAAACGKRGVQARMIESVLPELEREANSILTLLTGGNLHLKLVTQIRTKKGSEREVLRVVVSSGNGERPFELYSGGEAFRISFALRLAISALLTGGRGESRPLLVVDEGFGTQDAEGLNALVEAIGRVSAGFGLILVITHLEELKSRFDRVIEVERDEKGFSRVRAAG